jgi:PAS domain S-box-containing protein
MNEHIDSDGQTPQNEKFAFNIPGTNDDNSEEQWIALAQNSDEIIIRWDVDLKVIFANTTFQQLIGLPLSRLLGKTNTDMGQPVYFTDSYMQKLQTVFHTGETQQHLIIQTKSENEVYHHYRLIPEIVPGGNGDIQTVLSVGRDITWQQQARTLLKDHTLFIESITRAIPDILHVMELQTRKITYTSRSIAEELGYSRQQATGMKEPYFLLMHEEDIHPMLAHIDAVQNAANGVVAEIEYRMKHADGSLHWFRDRDTVFKRDTNGIAIEKIGISQDITERKLQEEEITRQHAFLKQTEELAQTGSWDFNTETNEFTWSDGMYALFDIPKGLPVKPSVYLDYAVAEDMVVAKEIVDAIQVNFQPVSDALLRIKVNDALKILKIKAELVNGDKLQPPRMLGVDMDVTDSKLAEEKIVVLNKALLTQNRQLESLTSELRTFNAIAANDYKETLKHLYTSLEFLISNDARNLSNQGKASIRRAQSAIQKIKLLTDDIVSYSRIDSIVDEMVSVELNNILKTVKHDLEKKIKEASAIITCGECPAIQGYPLLISLLFFHLIDNAIKFKREDADPVIEISHIEIKITDTVEKIPVSETTYKVITVSDNGIGFNPQYAENIFGMFYRLHENHAYKGSGIGLAICKKIMDIHGGFIKAESEEGKGSTFSCYFPVSTNK